MEDKEIVQKFLDYLKLERRFSGHTAKSYGCDLRQFDGFLAGTHKTCRAPGPSKVIVASPAGGMVNLLVLSHHGSQLLLSATTDKVRAFLAFLEENGYSKASIRRKLFALRSFYKYLVKGGQLSSNPAAPVKIPEQEKKPPRFLEYEEVKNLLEAPKSDNWMGARDRAILETLYSTGVKVSELVALNTDDIDFLGEIVHIRGKGKRERIAPIGSSALQVIQHYMEFRNKRAQSNSNFDSEALFVNKHGRRLNTHSAPRKMDKYLKIAGLDPSISPKTLRHSFAVHMLNNGADLRSVQELLGLQDRKSTRVYKQLTASRLAELANKE